MAHTEWIIACYVLLLTLAAVKSFDSTAARIHRKFLPPTGRRTRRVRNGLVLFGGASDGSDDGDSLRRILEASWNTSKMGRVPADPKAAAKEAYGSILKAAGGTPILAPDGSDGLEEGTAGIFFVDLLLPSYDISQTVEGTSLYDEVTAVEYCIDLADCFQGKSEILVRDSQVLETVEKVLRAREDRKREEEQRERLENESDGDFVFGDGNFVEDDDDDDDDDDDVDDKIEPQPENDAIREKLMASWSNDALSEDGIDVSASESETLPEPPTTDPSKSYRLASLFGKARIIPGPDMASAVVQAVKQNALPMDNEENLIVLSAVGRDEMVAVRALAGKYADHKKVVLVNCQFQPVPRELLSAETVYSVLPLAGKKRTSQKGTSAEETAEDPPPKIVVLRRYPRDWEIFVDVGAGYELAETVPANLSNRRGLSLEFIAGAVERHLEFVSRR